MKSDLLERFDYLRGRALEEASRPGYKFEIRGISIRGIYIIHPDGTYSAKASQDLQEFGITSYPLGEFTAENFVGYENGLNNRVHGFMLPPDDVLCLANKALEEALSTSSILQESNQLASVDVK